MSSTPTTTSTVMRSRTTTTTARTTTTTATTATRSRSSNNINGRLTYWCYQCDMSVSLFSSSPPLHCPHCRGQFLVEMDDYSSSTSNPRNPNPNSNHPPPLHPFPTIDDEDDLDSSSFQIPSSIRVSDAYLLDRLIQHLSDPQVNDATHGRRDTNTTTHHHHGSDSLPASKACVESIPTLKITSSYLASETIICAVCKDEFLIDDEAKQLPCNHIYHFDCIIPWLKQHNSCPVCRFRLPVDRKPERKRFSRRNQTRVSVTFGNLVENNDDDDDDDDEEEVEEEEGLFGMESTLRQIARRHRLFHPTSRLNAALDSSSSPTQMAQAETSSAGPANSGETVSSWPIEGGSRMGGGAGGGSGSGGAGSGRVDEEGDTVMSEARGGY